MEKFPLVNPRNATGKYVSGTRYNPARDDRHPLGPRGLYAFLFTPDRLLKRLVTSFQTPLFRISIS